MRKIMVVMAMFLATTAFGQDLAEFVKDLKVDLKSEKVEYIKKGMVTFTDEESARFWPIYNQYSEELGKFVDARVALMSEYADTYDTMTDEKANQLISRRLDIQRRRAALDEQYRKKFATALSPRRLARFYQIEHELQLLIELQAVSQIPRMKWW